MKTFRPDKKLRRKHQHKDYKRRLNILKSWQKEQENRRRMDLPLRKMPLDFPPTKKWTKSLKKKT